MNYFGSGGGFETLGLESLGIDMSGAIASPLPDVSNGGENMQGSYPGTSDGGAFNMNTLFGGLNRVLDYAIIRDQQKLQYSPERLVYAQQVGQIQTEQVQAKDNGTLFKFLLIGGVLFLVFGAGGGGK